ncbi:MAG: hypothetical protein H6Q69_143 [Firmicutes bacterium]|nr:hypothetical protein [Bacillota bacterium]
MSKTFTNKAKKRYEKSCEANKGQNEFYYCATSTGVTKRNLDLNSEYVFCQSCPEESKNNTIKEYKLQAFMIKTALKEAKHLLPIKGKEWVFLDAERNFAKDDLSEVGNGRRLDILAYDESSMTYIVLELKSKRDSTSDDVADRELLRYVSTIENHIEKANEFYSANAQNVKGYIVWPSNKNPEKNDKPWGLIEYEENFLDDIENLNFKLIKEPS